MNWGNFKILLYLFILSLAACHPERSLNRELNIASSIIEEEPDTALCILKKVNMTSGLTEEEYATYCLLRTQAEEENQIPHTSDSMISVALDYFRQSPDSLSKAKCYYYMGCVNEDMGNDSLATKHYLIALSTAEKAGNYKLANKICQNLVALYKQLGLYEMAFDIQQKAYANKLLMEKTERDQYQHYILWIILICVLIIGSIIFLSFHRWKKAKDVLTNTNKQLEESNKLITNQKLELVSLKKDIYSLQKKNYEKSEVITKIRNFNNKPILKEKPLLTESDWNQYLDLLEDTYRLLSRLRKKTPRLTDDDIRICALLREGVSATNISSIMAMTPETLARRMQRIKTDKMGLNEQKISLESIIKSY